MKKGTIYTSHNIIWLVVIFIVIFWLLYALASFLHESRKIQNEIEAIRTQNEKNLEEIEIKKRRLEYLHTSQHIDKEAKIQMGKKQPGEQVLVFIEEKLPILPSSTERAERKEMLQDEVPVLEKWKWLFLGKR